MAGSGQGFGRRVRGGLGDVSYSLVHSMIGTSSHISNRRESVAGSGLRRCLWWVKVIGFEALHESLARSLSCEIF